MIQLLRQGLGLPEAQIHMGTGHEDWTLGAALAEGGKLGFGSKSSLVSRNLIFAALGSALLVWFCFVAYILRSVSQSF